VSDSHLNSHHACSTVVSCVKSYNLLSVGSTRHNGVCIPAIQTKKLAFVNVSCFSQPCLQ
jgi:hypothetical protein